MRESRGNGDVRVYTVIGDKLQTSLNMRASDPFLANGRKILGTLNKWEDDM